MKQDFVKINSVPTRILTWGKWITDNFDDETENLVILISGSPGIITFYTKFCQTIYENLNGIPVWAIGHAGHDDCFETVNTPCLYGNEMFYDLEGQIRHKIEFIENFVPANVKVILIGYSVGARMCVELLDHQKFKDKITQCYLLFPAIERFGESAAGRMFPRIDKFFFIARFSASIFHQFPMFIRRPLVRFALRFISVDEDEFEDSLLQLTCPKSVNKLWYLAMDSFYKIKNLNDDIVESNLHRIKIYYGAKDEFVRKKFYYNIIEKFPKIDAQLCTKNIPHMFMLKNSVELGEMVCQWINEKQS